MWRMEREAARGPIMITCCGDAGSLMVEVSLLFGVIPDAEPFPPAGGGGGSDGVVSRLAMAVIVSDVGAGASSRPGNEPDKKNKWKRPETKPVMGAGVVVVRHSKG